MNKNMIFFIIPTKFVRRQLNDVSSARQIDPDPAPEDNTPPTPRPIILFLRPIYIYDDKKTVQRQDFGGLCVVGVVGDAT